VSAENTPYQGSASSRRKKTPSRSVASRQAKPLRFDELTDVQNACLEAAQEAAHSHTRDSLICAADVVAHVTRLIDLGETATIARPISRAQASRALQQLCAWKILQRETRDSRGWGQGWYPVYYTLNDKTALA
jgi:hypothetical protein